MPDSAWYVYGVVPDTIDMSRAPAGLENESVLPEASHGVAALVSRVDAADFGPQALEERAADVQWLGPRAVAHDRVLSWASDCGPVVPLPMFSIFSSREAIQRMLGRRLKQLQSAMGKAALGREYALRVYCVDAELLSHVDALSPKLRDLRETAEAASPGQRYLLERKLDAARKSELRAIGRATGTDVLEALAHHSVEAIRSPVPAGAAADAPGVMILNAAFLVSADAFTAFQLRLSEIVRDHMPRGFRFDFTGPWPPYHFVRELGDER